MSPKLIELYKAWRSHPLVWGVHDCVLWSARCVDVKLGTDYEHEVLKEYQYKTGLAAARYVRSRGGLGLMVSRYLGTLTCFGRLSQGDIVVTPFRPGVEILGVLAPNGVITTGPKGLVVLQFDISMKGWRLCPKHS